MGFLIAILILIGSGIMGGIKLSLSSAHGFIAIGAGIAIGLAAISAIGQGFVVSSGITATSKDSKNFGKSLLFSVLPQTQSLYGFLIAILILVGGGIIGVAKPGISMPVGLIAIGAGISVGLAAVSAIGQGIVASSGVNAVAAKPKSFGKSILFSVLPETQALYGFLIAILLLVGGGIIGAEVSGLTVAIGLIAIGAGLAIGLAAISAIGQGIAASSGITATASNPKMFGKSILFSVLPETQALYGFLIAVLMLVGGGILGATQVGITTPLGIIAIGASLAVGIAGISALGQGTAAASGIASVNEKPSMFGKSIIFSIIPETQALMGFLIAILMLIGAGLMGGVKAAMNISHGYIAIGAGLAIGIAAISAFGQGFVVSTGIAVTSLNNKNFGKSLLFSVLPQTQSLYGFLIAILILVGGGIIGTFKPDISLPVGLITIGAGLAVGLAAISAVGQGIAASSGVWAVHEKEKMFGRSILFSVLPETQALYGFLISIILLSSGGILGKVNPNLTIPIGLVAIGAGISIGIACISAIGQGIAASSGIGSVTDKEESFGKSILFSVLPETQALYGIIIAILLLTGVGLLGTAKSGITMTQGIGGIGIGIAMGLAAVSAVGQGIVASSSIGAILRDAKSTGKSLVLSVIPETYAIFGLLISILMLIGLKFI
jgi:V/A-type H+-transporting ATPase subunit K